MIDRSAFFAEVERRAQWLDIETLADIGRELITPEGESEIIERALRQEVRRLMSAKDADGNRVFHNIEVDGKNVWKKEELFDADDYFDVIAYGEREVERIIRKNMRLRENARKKEIEIQLRFELDLV